MIDKKSYIIFWTFSIFCIIFVYAISFFYFRNVAQSNEQQKKPLAGQEKIKMIYMPPYPKTITVRNLYDNTQANIPIEDFAGIDQVVFLKNGTEVSKQWMADQIAWIYREEILPFGVNSEKVPLDKAVRLEIKQYGKNDELLREKMVDRTQYTKPLPPPEIPIPKK